MYAMWHVPHISTPTMDKLSNYTMTSNRKLIFGGLVSSLKLINWDEFVHCHIRSIEVHVEFGCPLPDEVCVESGCPVPCEVYGESGCPLPDDGY